MQSFVGGDREIVAQVQLLKAFLQQKVGLNQQIGLMKVKASYLQSNNDFKVLREIQAVVKLMAKRLNDLRIVNTYIHKTPILALRQGNFDEFLKTLVDNEQHLEVPRNIFSINFEDETQNEELKEKYEALVQEYEEKADQYKHFEMNFEQDSILVKHMAGLEQEVYDLQLRIDDLSSGNKRFEEKKVKKRIMRKSSFEKIKIFHRLSENALKLRSKLLLRQEMTKNLVVAEEEMQNMQIKINEDEENIKLLQQESKIRGKSFAADEEELKELKKNRLKIEMRLEGLRAEKDDLLKILFGEDKLEEEFEEDETFQGVNWSTGFEKMQKEKNLLFEENQKLKERISKLGNQARVHN